MMEMSPGSRSPSCLTDNVWCMLMVDYLLQDRQYYQCGPFVTSGYRALGGFAPCNHQAWVAGKSVCHPPSCENGTNVSV